jgi:hypothetical protein
MHLQQKRCKSIIWTCTFWLRDYLNVITFYEKFQMEFVMAAVKIHLQKKYFMLLCKRLINLSRLLKREIKEGVLAFICFRAFFMCTAAYGSCLKAAKEDYGKRK